MAERSCSFWSVVESGTSPPRSRRALLCLGGFALLALAWLLSGCGGGGSEPAAGGDLFTSPDASDPDASDPGTGDPGTGDPGTGDPGTGDPGTGDPGTGDPGTGDPGAGDPGTPPGSVTLAWDAPTSNADGSPLNDLVGYRIYDGVVSGVYDMVTDVGAVTQFSFDALSPGTYFFAVTAYDTFGNESVFSGEIQVSVGP